MRTTLSVDDDLMEIVRQRAAELQLPIAKIVNRALRRGLAEEERPPPRTYATITFGSKGAAFPSPEGLTAADRALEDAVLVAELNDRSGER